MDQTITRAMLCSQAADKTQIDRHVVGDVCESMFRILSETLMQGESVKLTGFASLQVRARAERIGRNPRTGTEHKISPRMTVVLIPSAQMRAALDGHAEESRQGLEVSG